MEDTDWAVTGLFSPSKARIAQAQAKDWSFVDAWLTKKYVSGRVPAFERNEDTLEALLALIKCNDAADERKIVVERIEKSALQFYAKQRNDLCNEVFKDIVNQLNNAGEESLAILAHASLLLHSPIKHGISELVGSAINLQAQVFENEQARSLTSSQNKALRAEHDRLRTVLTHLSSAAFIPPSDMADDTAQWLKGVKHLRAKISEYDERLVAMRPAQSLLPLLEESRKADAEMSELKKQIAQVDADLEALQSFPIYASQAAMTLSEAKQNLMRIQSRRDALLDK